MPPPARPPADAAAAAGATAPRAAALAPPVDEAGRAAATEAPFAGAGCAAATALRAGTGGGGVGAAAGAAGGPRAFIGATAWAAGATAAGASAFRPAPGPAGGAAWCCAGACCCCTRRGGALVRASVTTSATSASARAIASGVSPCIVRKPARGGGRRRRCGPRRRRSSLLSPTPTRVPVREDRNARLLRDAEDGAALDADDDGEERGIGQHERLLEQRGRGSLLAGGGGVQVTAAALRQGHAAPSPELQRSPLRLRRRRRLLHYPRPPQGPRSQAGVALRKAARPPTGAGRLRARPPLGQAAAGAPLSSPSRARPARQHQRPRASRPTPRRSTRGRCRALGARGRQSPGGRRAEARRSTDRERDLRDNAHLANSLKVASFGTQDTRLRARGQLHVSAERSLRQASLSSSVDQSLEPFTSRFDLRFRPRDDDRVIFVRYDVHAKLDAKALNGSAFLSYDEADAASCLRRQGGRQG